MTTQKVPDTKIFSEVLKMLVSMIDLKGDYIWGHAERVANNCVQFAKHIALPKRDSDRIYLAALLHDIGMIYIPLDIIKKPSRLDEGEMTVIRDHPLTAEKVLAPMSIFKDVIPIIRHHHEFFDGSGYPHGLRRDEIPIGSRLLCIIDSYEAMIAPRAHRPAMTPEQALEQIKKDSGRKFDGKLIREFEAFLQSTPSVSNGIALEQKTIRIRDAVQDIVQKMRQGEMDMPVLPKVVGEIQRVINRPDTNIDAVAQAIEKDAVISVKMITVCNSSVYRGTELFTTVRQAVTRLGMKQVNSIIMTLSTRNLYRTANRQMRGLMEKLWMHSLATAYGARTLAQQLKFEDPERLFLMGLLHDIGMILLIKAIEEMGEQVQSIDMDSIAETLREFHTSIGAALLQRWKFPKDFMRVAEMHEGPHYFESTPREVLVVNVANHLSREIGYPMFADQEEQEIWDLEATKLLDIKPDILFALTERCTEIMSENGRMF